VNHLTRCHVQATPSPSLVCNATAGQAAAASDDAQRLIVRLHSYQPLAAAHALVSQLLQQLPAWSFAARSPLVSTFDTDFCVVQAPAGALEAVSAVLSSSERIRDVHEDRMLRKPLAQSKDRGAAQSARNQHSADQAPGGAGAPQWGSGSSFVHREDGTIEKRPGRLSTPWSWEDSELDEAGEAGKQAHAENVRARFHAHTQSLVSTPTNASAALEAFGHDKGAFPARHLQLWGDAIHGGSSEDEGDATGGVFSGGARGLGRRLLGGGTQVTSALHAAPLWNEGFRGEKIRVGARPSCRASPVMATVVLASTHVPGRTRILHTARLTAVSWKRASQTGLRRCRRVRHRPEGDTPPHQAP
jgi:hypothetical protein